MGNCNGDGCNWDYGHQRPIVKGIPQAAVGKSDMPVRGTMLRSDLSDYIIDIQTLDVNAFLKKYC